MDASLTTGLGNLIRERESTQVGPYFLPGAFSPIYMPFVYFDSQGIEEVATLVTLNSRNSKHS